MKAALLGNGSEQLAVPFSDLPGASTGIRKEEKKTGDTEYTHALKAEKRLHLPTGPVDQYQENILEVNLSFFTVRTMNLISSFFEIRDVPPY